MTISTMEALEALTPGTRVVIQDHIYTRTDAGFSNADGTPLITELFSGAVQQKVVRLADPPPLEAGHVFSDGVRRQFVVGHIESEHNVVCAVFSEDWSFLHLTGYQEQFLRGLTQTDPPEWLARSGGLVLLACVLFHQSQERDASPFPERFVDRAYVLADRGAGIDDLLDEFNAGRERDHAVKVTITGSSFMPVSDSTALDFLGYDLSIDNVASARVEWTRVVTVNKHGIGCMCDEVVNADVEQFLPSEYESYDFEVECG